jgi:CHRD domain
LFSAHDFILRHIEPTIFRAFHLFYYLAGAKTYCMRFQKLFYIPVLLIAAFAFNSCSEKVDVNLKRKEDIAMDGNQLVPAVPGAWNGKLDVEYNKDQRILYYRLNWNSLSGAPTGIGLYGTARKGYNAAPIQSITSGFPLSTASGYVGSVFIDGTILKEEALYNGEYYIVLKTTLNKNGEIRGQVELP